MIFYTVIKITYLKGVLIMIYSHEVKTMCPVAIGVNHGPAPIPEEAKWVKAKEVKIFLVWHTVLAGVHLNKELVN